MLYIIIAMKFDESVKIMSKSMVRRERTQSATFLPSLVMSSVLRSILGHEANAPWYSKDKRKPARVLSANSSVIAGNPAIGNVLENVNFPIPMPHGVGTATVKSIITVVRCTCLLLPTALRPAGLSTIV